MEKFDCIIIGGGPAGYVAAIRAAQFKMKVLCVDSRKEFGGTCLNVGCIPSKSLLYTSHIYESFVKHGQSLGLGSVSKNPSLAKVMNLKDETVSGLTGGIKSLFKMKNVSYANGTASFISKNQVEVDSGKDVKVYQAPHIIIATGSTSVELPFMPFDEKFILSSTGALALDKIPKKMAIVGAGVIGVELGSVYARLGSKVTIIEMLDRICPSLDEEVGKHFHKILEGQGLEFILSAAVKECKKTTKGIKLTYENEGKSASLSADCVLVAVGRKPNTQGLGLEKIGVKISSSGHIPVTNGFKTSQNGIYAIGDVIEGSMLAHRASEEAVALIESLNGEASHVHYYDIPDVIYTEPEVAGVGLTEAEARTHLTDIVIGKHSFKGNPRARCSSVSEGFVKLIFDKKTQSLVGMHILGPNASELICFGMLAIEKKVTMKEIASLPFAHPTLSESIKEAALKAMRIPIHQ